MTNPNGLILTYLHDQKERGQGITAEMSPRRLKFLIEVFVWKALIFSNVFAVQYSLYDIRVPLLDSDNSRYSLDVFFSVMQLP